MQPADGWWHTTMQPPCLEPWRSSVRSERKGMTGRAHARKLMAVSRLSG